MCLISSYWNHDCHYVLPTWWFSLLILGARAFLTCAQILLRKDGMILYIEFSIAHEPFETSIGLLKGATKDISPFCDIGNKTFYVPSVQEKVSENQYE